MPGERDRKILQGHSVPTIGGQFDQGLAQGKLVGSDISTEKDDAAEVVLGCGCRLDELIGAGQLATFPRCLCHRIYMVQQERSGKLVRDRIPDIIREAGGDPTTTLLGDEDYTEALRLKLLEEVEELLAAPAEKRIEEVADVVEVLEAMVQDYGLDWDEVEAEGLRKRHERGGFEGRVWLDQ